MKGEGASIVTSGFVQLFGSQLLTRLFTFALNLATARSLSPASYGIAAVQFHLINTTILFLSREGFRRGCLRVDPNNPHATRKVLGAALLTIPIGALLSILVTAFVLFNTPADDQVFRWAAVMQGVAAFIELCAEPLYILATVRLWFKVRVLVEAAATLAKNGITLALLLYTSTSPAMAFSYGQLAYGASTLLGFAGYFAVAGARDSKNKITDRGVELDRDILRISGAFSLQAGGKLLLAEGSKAVLAAATPLQEQGVYGLVNNLGSLVVRTLFQPYEEIAFVAFSRPPSSAKSNKRAAAQERASLLSSLCRSISLLGGLAAAFGPAYSYIVLFILYGRKWAESGAPAALALYSCYVALLAVNGTLEAFVHAVADQGQLHKANIVLIAVSVAHMGLSTVGVKTAGAAGLLIADAINMAIRILYCLWFISIFFKDIGGTGAVKLLPSRRTRAALVTALMVTMLSQAAFMSETSPLQAAVVQGRWAKLAAGSFAVRAFAHVVVGILCLAAVVATAYLNEADTVAQVKKLRKKRD